MPTILDGGQSEHSNIMIKGYSMCHIDSFIAYPEDAMKRKDAHRLGVIINPFSMGDLRFFVYASRDIAKLHIENYSCNQRLFIKDQK